jgi:hypothetical protein
MIPQSAPTSSFLEPRSPHPHIDGETCPWCEQEIPPERLKEIRGKIAEREREQRHAITAKLEQQYIIDKEQADAKAKADLELERHQSAAREASAREEAREAAETAAAERLAAAERSRQELQAALQKQFEQSEVARTAAEQARVNLQAQIQQLREDSETALATAKADAKARETEIRTQAQQAAEAAAAEKLAASESARLKSEAELQARIIQAEETRAAAEQRGTAIQLQLDELRKAKEADVAKVKEDAAAEALRIRREATEAAEGLMRDKIADKDKAVADAQARTAEAEVKLEKAKDDAINEMNQQREALEKDKIAAVNAERAKNLETRMNLEEQLQDMQRRLQKKPADEHGEGAELELFELLKAAFPDDRIRRVEKGAMGADIVHDVVENGKVCGKIVYDRKNRSSWKTEYATKLRDDQIAEKADHAILSTNKFPEGEKQLCMREHVILACPARVPLLAELLREHIIQMHELRVSTAARDEKTADLYAFINSERCRQLLDSIETLVKKIEEIDVAEQKAHRRVWINRGELLKSVLKANGVFRFEIDRIIGTAADDEAALEDER